MNKDENLIKKISYIIIINTYITCLLLGKFQHIYNLFITWKIILHCCFKL